MKVTRILIVEDETIVALDIRSRLLDMGYEVAGMADRGDDALAQAASVQPDLVLMDIRLKGPMDGIEAAAEIRRRWCIPVVFLTAFSEASTLQRAKISEPFGYIIKPFEDRELQAAIEMGLYKHQAERQLRESERRYATTLTSIGDGVIATDSQGSVTFMNPVAEKLTGWSRVEANGRPLAEIFRIANEQTHQPVEDPVAKVLIEGRVVGLAKHSILCCRDGREIPIDDCAAPIFDDLGQPTGTVMVFQDVTERRQNEAELRRIEWMLTPRPQVRGNADSLPHAGEGNLTLLSTYRLIRQSVGQALLRDIVSDCMDMLETSVAVCERNGEQAFGIQASGWCGFMGDSERSPCHPPTSRTVLSGDPCACQDCCCRDVSRRAMERAEAVDVACRGGMHFYAMPIRAGEEIVGSISVGYGDPPLDPVSLRSSAERFGLSFDELQRRAAAYQTRPAFIIELAKRRLESSARLIGEIVQRRILEQKQRESEERFRLLFNSISDAVFVHGFDAAGLPGQFIEVNDIACQRLGYTRRELLQMGPEDIDAPEAFALVAPVMERLSVEGHAVWEGVHVTKDGRRIPVEISNRLFELRGERVALATVRDISARKEAEEENRRLRNSLANIIDSMPSVLVGVDRNGCVTQWNAAAQAKTKICAEEAEGQPLERVLPTLARHLDKAGEAIRSGKVRVEPKISELTDGELYYEDVTVYPLTADGIEGAVIRVDDVTERVRLEELMIQSEKMLSVGGLAAGMAHEINNPLGVILQATQNIQRRFSRDLPTNALVADECGTSLDSIRKYLERREISTFLDDIQESGQRAAEIVSNMLSFSRKPEGGGSPKDLAELLDRTVSLAASDYDLKRRYDFRRIEIVREYEPGLPPVICQAGKIQQVFLNILRNGAEAMKDAGDGKRSPRFVLRVKREGPMVRAEIEDNGPGMEEAVRRRAFEPFFTTKPAGVGTGLGLSVSYFIVTEDHGGTLSVESEPGSGARFIVRLPASGQE
ncbi:MAG: PAS domain S-box protein [Syntrophobacteraceae bacterium]